MFVRRRGAAVFGASAVFVATFAFAPDARAEWDFQFAFGVNAGWLRKTPSLSGAVASSARDQHGGRVAMRGNMFLVGPYLDLALTLDDRWLIPLGGGAVAWAVGAYDSVVTSLDGSVATVRPWTGFRGDLLLPGFGVRMKHRRFMWAAAARVGASWLGVKGSEAAGASSEPVKLSASTFLVQIEIEACRRLDPTTRACLLVTPRVYEHELAGGLSLGLRMEWGK